MGELQRLTGCGSNFGLKINLHGATLQVEGVDFYVRDGGVELGAPVDEALGAVDGAVVVHTHERLAHSLQTHHRVHGDNTTRNCHSFAESLWSMFVPAVQITSRI